MEHVDIPDGERHEPKGASSATLNEVVLSNGDGTTRFGFVDYSDLLSVPTPVGIALALYATSPLTSQKPTAVDSPIQLTFGSAQSGTYASLSSLGAVTINQSGVYHFAITLRYNRDNSTGNANIYSRLLLNGAQTLGSNAITLQNAGHITPQNISLIVSFEAGDVITAELYRDSSGTNDGGIYSSSPVLSGWALSPACSLLIHKLGE